MANDNTSSRGFASMSEGKQREIASKGGQSVPDEKRSFSQNRELAAEAGRKGGQNVPDEKRSFSQNRNLAAEAGRKGGEASGGGNRGGGERSRREYNADEAQQNPADDPQRASETGGKGGRR